MFENIIGHHSNKKILEKHIMTGNISHSYLFEGKDGIGKKLMAYEFAKNILKVDNLNSSPDFKFISRQEGKKDIIIEQVRKQLIDDVYIVPSSGDKKVYIIDEAELLNIAAQNALLKTLEEPPSYVVIILISSNISAFLPTIISRLNILSFGGIENNELKEYITKKYKVDLSNSLIEYLEGSIGQAETIVKNNLTEKFLDLDELLKYIMNKDTLNVFLKLKDIDFNDKNMLDYFEYILYKNNCYQGVFVTQKARQRLKYNGNYDIVVDSMILKIIDSI